MKRWMLAGLFVLALSLLLSEAHGDLIGPRRPGLPVVPPRFKAAPFAAKLVVKVSDKAKQPVLQVPINLALGQQANAGIGQASEAQPEDDRRFGLPTVVAGLALTLAFASGGLWMVRRGSGRTLAMIVVVSVFAAGTAAVWADIGPRPAPRPRPPVAPVKPVLTTLKLPAGIELTDKLILEPMPPGDHLTLIVPKSMVVEKGEKKEAPREKRSR